MRLVAVRVNSFLTRPMYKKILFSNFIAPSNVRGHHSAKLGNLAFMLKQVREITCHAPNIRHPPPRFVHCTQETLCQIWCLLPVSHTSLKITLSHNTVSMHDIFTDKELW